MDVNFPPERLGLQAAITALCLSVEALRRQTPEASLHVIARNAAQILLRSGSEVSNNGLALFDAATALSSARRESPPGQWFDGSLHHFEKFVEQRARSLWSHFSEQELNDHDALRVGMLPLAQLEWMQDVGMEQALGMMHIVEHPGFRESPLATLWDWS